MSRWSHLFFGRENELGALRTAWQRAKAGSPQIVPIIAETGYGKTRLAQEFFNWLSSVEDGVGGDGYWPDCLLRVADNLQPNPSVDACAVDGRSIPFLWWGLRLSDPGERNEIATTALRTGEEYLKAHLAAYSRTLAINEKRRQQAISGSLNVTDIAMNIAGGLPVIGTVFAILGTGKTLVQGGLEVYRLETEIGALRESGAGPGAAAASNRTDLVDMIVSDLRCVAHAPPTGMTAVPIVILLDDLHWARKDEALCALVERLLAIAGRERWPLLVIATCWEQEWQRTDAAGVKSLMTADGVECHPLFLRRAPDLAEMVRFAFPGLTPSQVTLLLDQADGNPRFLDELLNRLDRAPKLFVQRDREGPLTKEGEALIATETFEDAVLDRLQATPVHVQAALGLASLQGIRFSGRIVEATAQRLDLVQTQLGLTEGENPYAFISSEAFDASEFRARAYFEVAKSNLPNIADLAVAEAALRAELTKPLGGGAAADASVPDDVLEAQIALFESSVLEERNAALAAVAELVRRSNARHDYRTAGRLARIWINRWTSGSPVNAETSDMYTMYNAVEAIGDHEAALAMAQSLLDNAVRRKEEYPERDERAQHASALLLLGDSHRAMEGYAAGLPYYREAAVTIDILARESGSADDRRRYWTARSRIAMALNQTGERDAAIEIWREELAAREEIPPDSLTPHERRDLGVLLQYLADMVRVDEGDEEALGMYERSLALHTDLVAETGERLSRRDESVLQCRVGDVLFAQGRFVEAAASYQRSTATREDLYHQLGSAEARLDLEDSLVRMGNALSSGGDPTGGLECLRRALPLRRMRAAEVGTLYPRRELVQMLLAIGNIVRTSGSLDETLAAYREGLDEARSLRAAFETANSIYTEALFHSQMMKAYWARFRVLQAWREWRAFSVLSRQVSSILASNGRSFVQIFSAIRSGTIPDLVMLDDGTVAEQAPADVILPDVIDTGSERTGPRAPETEAGIHGDQPAIAPIAIGPDGDGSIPRNSMCNCESGLRYKHCHGRVGGMSSIEEH